MTSLALVVVLTGSSGGSAGDGAPPAAMPECVAAWMDTSAAWSEFQAAVEDSLQAERLRRREVERQLEIALLGQGEHSPWWKWWVLPVAVTGGIVLGARAAR